MILRHSSRYRNSSELSYAFTLVEVLVVLALLTILASIALPLTKELLLDQKNSRAARSFVSYVDIARSRAVAEQRLVGVRLERLATDVTNEYGSSVSIRTRQLTGLPPYCGDSADVRCELLDLVLNTGASAIPGIDTAEFELADNQLLAISHDLLNDADPANDLTAPIQPGDRIELPSGRMAVISDFVAQTVPATMPIQLRFDLRKEQTSSSTFQYPQGARRELAPITQRVRFKIHRSPALSSTSPLTFPRGVAIDLNYSGFGLTGNQFERLVATGSPPNVSIDIVFGPDGRVAFVNDQLGNTGTPTGQIYICLGDTDGVRPDNLFSTESRSLANILNPKSSWIVINHATGRTVSSPFASVTDATVALPQTTTAELDTKLSAALLQARALAVLSDTLDAR